MRRSWRPPFDDDSWLAWLATLTALYVLVVALLAGLELGTRARNEVAFATLPASLFHPVADRGDPNPAVTRP